ncbi:hypothetical protein CRENBAI_010782 [Crenichthys baileyi]|uniref:Uncharacterized protein n=1 Tax=Crenichthys baileyi TaxID=28760 RepID=A0AAV9RJX1_9TELE
MEREAVQRRSPPAPLVAHPDPAAKPTSSSRRGKRRRGAPSRCSAGEEVGPMPADVKAAASNPASSTATALSARLAAHLPKPSSHSPAQDSVVTPDELEERAYGENQADGGGLPDSNKAVLLPPTSKFVHACI